VKTVLLADHHPPTLEHLRDALRKAGYAVHAVSDPGKAMEHVTAEPLDAVLVSVDFPHLSGQHLAQLIRARAPAPQLPVLAMDHGHLGRARGVNAILDLRASAYIADPTKLGDLTAKIATLVEAAQHARAQHTSGVHAVLARPPVASGELKGHPLPELLHSFHRLRRDGILVVAYRDLTRRVYFIQGVPVSYDSSARQDFFPSFLADRGALTADQAKVVVRSLAAGLRVGAALAEAQVDLQGEELLARLREYTHEKLAQVVGMREGRYAFYSGTEFIEEVAKVDIPALAPILEGARRAFPLRIFGQSLRRYAAQFPHRTPEFGKDLPALGLDTSDLKIAMQINGRIPLRELVAHGRGELREAYSLAWFLLLTGDIAFSDQPAAAADQEAYRAAERIIPRKRKPLPADKLAELRDAAVKILTGSYFKVLGLEISADTEDVERAYHEVAARFHPDSWAEYDTSEIRDLLDSVQDKLSGSYRVLSVEEKRKAYVQYLLSRLDVPRAEEIHVEAEIAMKRGELAMKRKDFISARQAFEEAVELNPREPEYYSFLAWATYLAGAGDRKERARAAQKVLKKALSLNAYLERALIISAIIEAEMGDGASAQKKLLRVLEMNPRSQLAKAALRKARR
jgi:CheY-like chemotaxis protein/tetratricopeptide (TPR) repeat protein